MRFLTVFALLAGCGTPADKPEGPDDSGRAVVSTDADGDGYGGTDDCNDQSSAVHPGAAEVCDGLDAGSSSYGRTTDFWGVTRSGNPDLGAVEY